MHPSTNSLGLRVWLGGSPPLFGKIPTFSPLFILKASLRPAGAGIGAKLGNVLSFNKYLDLVFLRVSWYWIVILVQFN